MSPLTTRGCRVCDGTEESFVVALTGAWAHIERLVYGGVRYFNHGAVYKDGATTLWLARGE